MTNSVDAVCLTLEDEGEEPVRVRYRDLTAQLWNLLSTDEKSRMNWIWMDHFELYGDPRVWNGFGELNDFASKMLNHGYEKWFELQKHKPVIGGNGELVH